MSRLQKVNISKYFKSNIGTKVQTPRASMHIREAESNISSSCTQWNTYDFKRAGVHAVSRLYTVSPRDGERFHLRTFLLHAKGTMTFAEIGKKDGVQYLSFGEASKAQGVLVDYAKWAWVLADSFRSIFEALMYVFPTILANHERSSLQDLWNDHRGMIITDVCNRFGRHRN